jgi:phosphotransferase system, enzyme I, PtsP
VTPAASFSASGGARRLLSRLRDVMAGSGTAQARLDKIVQLIAAEMGADVCSVYVMRAGEVLELFATQGLNPSAVHVTRMSVNEGLVGLVAGSAVPVKLANARNHPRFAYRPETGEDPFQSLAGAPILRGGRVRGVLIIQHKDRHDYNDDVVETLQTVAMIVAELIANGEMVGRGELATPGVADLSPTRLNGITLNEGVGIGLAVLHRPQITIGEMVADDPEFEMQRLGEALAKMRSALDELEALTAASGDSEHLDILETYRMLAEDRGWLRRISEAIHDGLSAEAAIQKVQNDTRARMAQMTDSYIRERLLDLEDVTNRLLYHLQGKRSEAADGTLPDEVILVARSMGPAELLDYDRNRLRGLVLEEGSHTAHVAIIARTLGIPVVGRCPDVLTQIDAFDPLIVDGDQGQVYVRPGEDVEGAYREVLHYRAAQRQAFRAERELPSITDDGYKIALNLNAGMLIDMAALDENGAEGVGLYRTEIPFMVRRDFPSVAAQTELYGKVLDQAAGRPVTFRTLDVGGDKKLAYLPEDHAENPAMGWRAIRMGLDRPAMLCQQLRALLAAAGDRQAELRIMFPMISDAAEFYQARALLDREIARRRHAGRPVPQVIKVGMMLEVPAVLWHLPRLVGVEGGVEFVSIGTNDLAQFLYACDRGDPRLHGRYDNLSPALLMVLRDVCKLCRERGVPVTVCGEMAARPLEVLALVGLGFRSLSMSAPSLARIKGTVRVLNVAQVTNYMERLLSAALPPKSLRGYLTDFGRDHGIPV